MGEPGNLGLNEHHEKQLVQFLRFCRFQRGQRVRAVDACFEETEKSRLNDTTFTKDEVQDLLKALLETTRAEFESELINTAHTSLLLLRQVCGQAEKWHLKLLVNLSELENRELLDAVQHFENQEFDEKQKLAANRPQITSILRRLEPIEYTSGPAPLLQTEIERLRFENERQRQTLQQVQGVAVGQIDQRKILEHQLAEARASQSRMTNSVDGGNSKNNDQEIQMLEQRLAALQGKLNENAAQHSEHEQKLESDLVESHKRLLKVKEQLEMTESELEKKFSQTAAYKNMKQMLVKKNKQMKELRQKLNKYEPQSDNLADED